MATKSEKLAVITAKIAALQAKYQEVEASNEVDDSGVLPGAMVRFVFGRGDKKRTYEGRVLARKQQTKGADLVRIQVGEGFDAEIHTALVAWVTEVLTPANADDALANA